MRSRSRWLPSGTPFCKALHGHKTISTTTPAPSISTARDQELQFPTESYYLEPVEYKIRTQDSIIGYLQDLKVVTEESSGVTRVIVPFLVRRDNSIVQKKDNCEKSESIKNLNEKVLLVGNQKKNFYLDTACPENRASIVVPIVNHTERDQLLNQSYCTSTTNIARKNTVQTTFSNKQNTSGLNLLTKTSTEEIPKRDTSGIMEYDLVEELYKPFQEDFDDIDFSAYSILQDLIDESSPSVDDYSGEASTTSATTAETTSTTLTPNIELKEEISPATTNQMDDIFYELEEDQLYGETVTQPDPAEMDFLRFSNDLNNEDTINLSETYLRFGSPSRVLRMDPLLCDSPAQIKPIKAELIPEDTVLSQESLSDMFLTQETLPYDTNNNSSNNNNNMDSKSIKPELLFEGIVSQESLPSIFNTPETIAHITNSNNGQKIKFEERKRKLYSAEGKPRPKKLILPMSRIITAEEVYPSTPEVIEKALDLEQERFPTSYNNSNNSSTFDLLLQNELSNCPSEDLSSNSSTVFTAPSTPFSYPSTSTTPTPTSQKRRGRPPKTDDSLPNPEELEHLSAEQRKYYELRGKNNMASRRSRQRRKCKDEKSKQELEELQCRNTALTSKYSSLEAIEKQLKTMLQNKLF